MVRRIPKLTIIIFIAWLMVLGLLNLVQTGSAKTITVDDDGGVDYTRIQDAIDNATEGDSIRVFEGTYNESIKINVSVTLIGIGSEHTIINAGYHTTNNLIVIEITADGVTIQGFTVRHSSMNWDNVGIHLNSDNNVLNDNNITVNDIGLLVVSSEGNHIENNTIMRNLDCGLHLTDNCDNNIIKGNYFSNNSGNAIKFDKNCTNNTIEENVCTNTDYGFSTSDPATSILISESNGNRLNNNSLSEDFIGIVLRESDETIIEDNNFSMNRKYAIYSIASRRLRVSRNVMNETGIRLNGDDLEDWDTHIIDETNRVNGKSILYFKNKNDVLTFHDENE